MHATDAIQFSNIAATTNPFTLRGGKYGVDVVANFAAGSVKFQKRLNDGTTWQSVSAGTNFTAAGFATVDLVPGIYRWTIATATGVFATVCSVPF